MNNRWYKKLLLLLTVGCMTVSMTGCSADSVLDKLLSVTDPKPDKKTEATKENSSDKKDSAGEKEVEVAKPEFTTNLSGAVTYAVNAKASALTVEVTTTDDGSITYQWYKSQTDTNGGGTLIDGATEASYTPPTDTEGTLYYYVVATSTIGSSTNGATSDTAEVIVSADGTIPSESEDQAGASKVLGKWVQNNDGWWYDNGDGTYPRNAWKQIDGKWYAFDEKGYMRIGWFKDGDSWYYLLDSGEMAKDTDIEGYHIGSNGKME